jgi:putative flippase GtrA
MKFLSNFLFNLHNQVKKITLAIQISRFVIVGFINVIISYITYALALFYFSILVSLILSYIIGILNSYLWNRAWTFESKNNKKKELIRFIAVYAFVFLINYILLFIIIYHINIDSRIAQIIVLPITTIISFIGHKYWSFVKDN